jgi:microcompartment protein CcmL/EutN
MTESLGIIETTGYVAAIQAADAAVKSAKVKLGQLLKVGGGRVDIIFRGDVASVNSAIEAGVKAASRVGRVEAQIIIPRPSNKLSPIFPIEITENRKNTNK